MKDSMKMVIRVLANIADGNRPNPDDRAAVRVAERRGYIIKNFDLMKFELTAKGKMLVNSGRFHGII